MNKNNLYLIKTKKHPVLYIFLKILLLLFILLIIVFTIFSIKYGFKKVVNKGIQILNTTLSPTSNKITILFNNIKGLNNIYYGIDKKSCSTMYYVNNEQLENINLKSINNSNDVKLVIKTNEFDRIINYPNGYYLSMPKELNYDFSLSPIYIKGFNEKYNITISNEKSPYPDVWKYIDYYQNRFFLNENYQKTNNIILHENITKKINGYTIQVISLTRQTDSNIINFNTYSYIYIKLDGQEYLRIMIKSKEYNQEHINICSNMANSFTQISKQFTANYTTSYFPIENDSWDTKTKNLYKKYINSSDIDWGIFTKDISNEGINKTIPEIESQIDYNFDVILMYNHLGDKLPINAINKITKQNKILELTIQTCYANNTKLYDLTPMFDILEGKLDDKIHTLAKEIKSLDIPILFRLNNEMNTDWTSYCAMTNLCDPEIYIEVWKKIYNIFEEENVNNCIWIYNPNDNNYPPSNWNNFLAFYPGNEYVDLIGITGYNTGTYYNKVTGEIWREFEEIYDNLSNNYLPHFSNFSWIITEFGSSSIGGDKINWINNMFKVIRKYPNIKIAVWFSYADYDENGVVARPYWLNETKECLEAFKNGIHNY